MASRASAKEKALWRPFEEAKRVKEIAALKYKEKFEILSKMAVTEKEYQVAYLEADEA